MSKYKFILQDAGRAYVEGKLNVASNLYKNALELIDSNHIQEDPVNKDIIKYIISLAALESQNIDDLNNAIIILHALEKSFGSKFPAIYYALGKANIKQYRFDAAYEAVKKGFSVLNRDVRLTTYNIPGTQTPLCESTTSGLIDVLMPLKEECSGWHHPDAVCNICQNVTQESSIPNRNIFFGDPSFNGMVRIVCNNSTNPCKVNFHQHCWKIMKETLSPVKKLSDKDVIGFKCFTPNCENDSTPSIIDRIEIIDENAEVKTVIEGATQPITQPVKSIPVTKGAIRKQIIQPKPKKRFEKQKKLSSVAPQTNIVKEYTIYSRIDLESNLLELIQLREDNFGLPLNQTWKPELGSYGNLNVDMNHNFYPQPDLSNGEFSELHSFLFSFLYEYIVESEFVKVSDILLKWNEAKYLIPASLSLVNTDKGIIDFLLDSLNIGMIGEYICTTEMLPNVYYLLNQETKGVLEIALNNSLNPVDTDFEGEDYDCLINLIQESGNSNTLFFEPQLQQTKNESTKSIIQSTQEINDPFKFYKNPIIKTVEDCNKNVNNSKYRDEEIVCENKFEEVSNVEPIGTVENKNKNRVIDEISLTVKNYFEEFEKQIERKKTVDSLSTKMDVEENTSSMNNIRNTPTDPFQFESNVAIDNIHKVLERVKNMDEDIYKKCVDHIAYLDGQLQLVTRQKLFAEQRITQLYQENGNIIEKFEVERSSLLEELKAFKNLSTETKDIQIRYKSQIDDYIKLRQELNAVVKHKQELKCELDECELDRMRLTETIKDLKKQMSKEQEIIFADLEQERVMSLEWKKILLKQYLDEQLRANGNLIHGHMEQCNIALHVFSYVNSYLKNSLNMTLFPEANEWNTILNELKELQKSQENECSTLCELLNLSGESLNLDDFNLKVPVIPPKPSLLLAESIQRGFQYVHMHFMMPRIPNMPPLPQPRPQMMRPAMELQPRYCNIPPNPPVYLMNHGYQYQRNIYAPPQVHPQPLVNVNFSRPPMPLQNNIYTEPSKSVIPANLIVINEDEKPLNYGSREESVNSNDVSVNEVEFEEKNELSEASSLGGSTNSLSMKSDTMQTTSLNGIQLKQPKFGTDRIMEKLRNEFIGLPEFDLIDCILEVRKMHNNSLTGLKTLDVINEVKELIIKKQRQYIFEYNDKNGSVDRKEEKSKVTESPSKEKLTENKNTFHPFAFERLSALRNRNNSVSSTSSVPTPNNVETQNTKKSSGKSAWVVKQKENNWTKETIEVECNICFDPLDNIGNKKTVYTLECQHSFHKECIKEWLQTSKTCPNCRVFATHDEDYPPLP